MVWGVGGKGRMEGVDQCFKSIKDSVSGIYLLVISSTDSFNLLDFKSIDLFNLKTVCVF